MVRENAMADTAVVKSRIDINLKNKFDLRPLRSKPLVIGAISKESLVAELQKVLTPSRLEKYIPQRKSICYS